MGLDWSSKLIKYALFTFNLVFVISGIILLAIGVSVKAYYYNYEAFLDDKYFSLPNLLIATGALIFFISFFGCCGAVKENWVLLYGFVGLLIFIFILEFSAGIAGYVLRDRTSSYLQDQLYKDLMKYGQANSDQINRMWDIMQYEFECCGVESPEDWIKNFKNTSLPTSCCKNPYGSVGYSNCAINTTGNLDLIASARKTRDVDTAEGSPAPSSPSPSPSVSASSPIPVISNTNGTTQNITNSSNPATPPSSPATTSATTTSTVTPMPFVSNGTYYKIGCVEGFGKFVKTHAVTLGGCGFAIAFMQLFGIIFACHLARKIKNGYYKA